jgi:hypothetical protein
MAEDPPPPTGEFKRPFRLFGRPLMPAPRAIARPVMPEQLSQTPQGITVHHGTDADISGNLRAEFAKNPHERAVFFTPDKAKASQYGKNVISGTLSTERPFVVTSEMFDKFARMGDPVQKAIEIASGQGHDYVEFDLPSGKTYAVLNDRAFTPHGNQ